jgi:hypothetical protein
MRNAFQPELLRKARREDRREGAHVGSISTRRPSNPNIFPPAGTGTYKRIPSR